MLTLEVEPFQGKRNTVCMGPGAEGSRAGMPTVLTSEDIM